MLPQLKGGDYVRAHSGADVNAHDNVIFFVQPVLNQAKSEAAGREIYDEIEMWELRFPGNNLHVPTGRVTDQERRRWPQQYDAFKKMGSHAEGISGTPLEQWPFVGRAMIAELRYLNILTVEHLAATDDNGISRIGPGGRKLVECAKAWLAEAEGSANTMALAAAKVQLQETVDVQNTKINELIAMVQGLTGQLAHINAAGAQGVGPAAIAHLSGPLPAAPIAPAPITSAMDSAEPEFKPRKVGRPSNADKAALLGQPPAA